MEPHNSYTDDAELDLDSLGQPFTPAEFLTEKLLPANQNLAFEPLPETKWHDTKATFGPISIDLSQMSAKHKTFASQLPLSSSIPHTYHFPDDTRYELQKRNGQTGQLTIRTSKGEIWEVRLDYDTKRLALECHQPSPVISLRGICSAIVFLVQLVFVLFYLAVVFAAFFSLVF